MIIFLYGSDSFRSKEKLDEIIAHYQEIRKSGLNLVRLSASQVSFLDFYHAVKTSSMFAETKLIILKDVFSNKTFQEELLAEVKNLQAQKDVVVVYENEQPDARLKLFKTLLKEAKSQEFELLDGRGIKAWAQKELEKIGVKMNADALDLLVNFVGNNLWQLSGELKKLAAYKHNTVIQKADVELLVKPNLESDIFKTIDALAEKNKKQALALLHKHLDGDDSPLYMLSMVAYQFRNLLMVKELAEKGLMYASIVKQSGLHPFVVKKSYFLCRQFSFLELKNIYRAIFKIDSDIKIGNVDAEVALDLLISKI